MKTIYIIGGPMGVGKTAVCQILKEKLDNAVFLDGDNCWDADPFIVTEETKSMVEKNICYLLNSFIHCSAYDNIIFCWVMHERSIIDRLCKYLDLEDCNVKKISLICSPDELRSRLGKDIQKGYRQPEVRERSLQKLPLYERLDTIKVDTTGMTQEEIARVVVSL